MHFLWMCSSCYHHSPLITQSDDSKSGKRTKIFHQHYLSICLRVLRMHRPVRSVFCIQCAFFCCSRDTWRGWQRCWPRDKFFKVEFAISMVNILFPINDGFWSGNFATAFCNLVIDIWLTSLNRISPEKRDGLRLNFISDHNFDINI